MQLIRIDANDRSILLVQISDFPHVLPAEDNVVVELVPEGCDGEFGAGEVREGAEVETAGDEHDAIRYPNEKPRPGVETSSL